MSVSFQNTGRIWKTVVISLPVKRSGLGLKPRTTRAQDMAWPWLDFLVSSINLLGRPECPQPAKPESRSRSSLCVLMVV